MRTVEGGESRGTAYVRSPARRERYVWWTQSGSVDVVLLCGGRPAFTERIDSGATSMSWPTVDVGSARSTTVWMQERG